MASPELTAADVSDAYSLILGRSVESDATIEAMLAAHGTQEALWRALLGSSEFQSLREATMGQIQAGMVSDNRQVRHEVSPQTLERLMDRIRREWTHLGEVEPHWSVLTGDKFKADQLDAAALAEFHASGHDMVGMLDLFETRTGQTTSRGVCLELGCGVGRITAHLARRFDRVIAVDISPGNLELCARHLASEGIGNVDIVQIRSPQDFVDLPNFDVFYSVIVLQHNPPPVQSFILQQVFSKVNPGGAALFQIPGFMANYAFEAESYLASSEPEMEMHALPAAVVLKLLDENGLVARDFTLDTFTGLYGSTTYFATRPL